MADAWSDALKSVKRFWLRRTSFRLKYREKVRTLFSASL